MRVTIAGRWRIEPLPSSLCWQILELKTVRSKADGSERERWMPLGMYPPTLECAYRQVFERMLKAGGSDEDLEGAMRQVRRARDAILEAARTP